MATIPNVVLANATTPVSAVGGANPSANLTAATITLTPTNTGNAVNITEYGGVGFTTFNTLTGVQIVREGFVFTGSGGGYSFNIVANPVTSDGYFKIQGFSNIVTPGVTLSTPAILVSSINGVAYNPVNSGAVVAGSFQTMAASNIQVIPIVAPPAGKQWSVNLQMGAPYIPYQPIVSQVTTSNFNVAWYNSFGSNVAPTPATRVYWNAVSF